MRLGNGRTHTGRDHRLDDLPLRTTISVGMHGDAVVSPSFGFHNLDDCEDIWWIDVLCLV